MRLFIAVPLPPNIKRIVQSLSEQLKGQCSEGRFVPIENYHITLRFIGESRELYDISMAMSEAARDAKPIKLKLDNYGCFQTRGSETGFVSVSGDVAELRRLNQTLESAMQNHGFLAGRGKFSPHITLARNLKHEDEIDLSIPNEAFWANSIVLYESTNVNGRMVYTPVHTVKF